MAVEPQRRTWLVVHPLDAEPECKYEVTGPMRLTPAVSLSLIALRVYLVLIMGLAIYGTISRMG